MALSVTNINFDDISNNSIIQDVDGTNNVLIQSLNGNIVLQPTGSVEFNNNIDCNGTSNINNIAIIHSSNNTDLAISSNTGQQINLQTSGTNRITLSSTAITSSAMPICTAIPTLNTQFMNQNLFTNIQTYTPAITLSAGVPTITYSSRGGRYIQYGNMVWFTCYLNLSNFSVLSGPGNIRVSIPVTVPTNGFNQSLIVGYYNGLNTLQNIALLYARIPDNATITNYFILDEKPDGPTASTSPLASGDISNSFSLVVTGNYYLF